MIMALFRSCLIDAGDNSVGFVIGPGIALRQFHDPKITPFKSIRDLVDFLEIEGFDVPATPIRTVCAIRLRSAHVIFLWKQEPNISK